MFSNCIHKQHISDEHQLRITSDGQPAIETGGVSRQLYTRRVYEEFAGYTAVKLFEGSENHFRKPSKVFWFY